VRCSRSRCFQLLLPIAWQDICLPTLFQKTPTLSDRVRTPPGSSCGWVPGLCRRAVGVVRPPGILRAQSVQIVVNGPVDRDDGDCRHSHRNRHCDDPPHDVASQWSPPFVIAEGYMEAVGSFLCEKDHTGGRGRHAWMPRAPRISRQRRSSGGENPGLVSAVACLPRICDRHNREGLHRARCGPGTKQYGARAVPRGTMCARHRATCPMRSCFKCNAIPPI
jgi:hypothetical protein